MVGGNIFPIQQNTAGIHLKISTPSGGAHLKVASHLCDSYPFLKLNKLVFNILFFAIISPYGCGLFPFGSNLMNIFFAFPAEPIYAIS
jgi:hypothetical protein